MQVAISLEIPDERTITEARDIITAIHELYDDVHVKRANLLNDEGQFLLDLTMDSEKKICHHCNGRGVYSEGLGSTARYVACPKCRGGL